MTLYLELHACFLFIVQFSNLYKIFFKRNNSILDVEIKIQTKYHQKYY